MSKFTKETILDEINKLQGYEGYVQFSHRPIDKEKDIFYDNKVVHVEDEEGFIYEAHFSNGSESVSIRQINGDFYLSKQDIKNADIQTYISDIKEFNYKVKMAQIWETEEDELCENMPVKKLKKVVFAGFEKGVSNAH